MAEMPEPKKALQPFTFCGVARFAQAPPVRVACIALVFALTSGAFLALFAWRAWFPVLTQAVENLPDHARIESGTLDWPGRETQILGTNSFLSISVQPGGDPPAADRDLNVRLTHSGWEVNSLTGYRFLNYPKSWIIFLDRTTMAPLWGAWQPWFVVAVTLFAALVLLATWSLLAVPYAIVPFLMAGPFRRDLTYGEAWKLSFAALLPGGVLMIFGTTLYAFSHVSLLFVLFVFAAHWLVPWLYIFSALFCVPASARSKNPFNPKATKRKKSKNPFASS